MWSEHAGLGGVRGKRFGVSPMGHALGVALAFLVSACGQDGTDLDGPGGASGTTAGGPGTTAGTNGPAAPGDGGALPDAADPAEAGRPLWAQHCAGCHGEFAPGSSLSSGNANGDFRLDVAAAIERHGDGLEAYIEMAMPMGSPESCTGECAQTLGAYLRSLLMPPGTAACTQDAGPAAGARQVLLLTSQEYQNALEDLLGVPTDLGQRVANHDGRRGGFVDMTGKSVSSTLLETYTRTAETAAEWAVGNGRPFDCSDSATCAQRFVDEFLFEAFRGPVSEEQKAAYRDLFTDYPDEALELALKAALTSPLFLYRAEVGVSLEEARAAGYYPDGSDSSSPGGGMPSSGTVTEVKPADQLGNSDGFLEGDVWTLEQNGSIRLTFSEPFADSTFIDVVARGSNHDDTWPELTLQVNGAMIGTQRVDSTDVQPYRFHVGGMEGTPTVELIFANDSGVPPYGPGQDANLYVQEVRLYTEGAPTLPGSSSSASDLGLLDGAAEDAFVLSPFELASTLAFRLTGSTPDRALLEAARNGGLATRAQVRSQVERLIDSERGRAHMGEFVTRWFRLDGLDQVSRPDVPELTDEVKAAMLEEVRAHFLHVFYESSAPYSEFLGGDYTFLNDVLAEFYGVPGHFDQSFRKTTVEGRGGPLASGAFMTVNAHADRTAPILRAVRSRETALCHYIDPPNSPIAGDDIDAQRAAAQERVTEQEQAQGGLSSRDFYFLYTDGIDACAGCHERIINPHFGMEDFDNVGRLRPSAGPNSVIETLHGMEIEVSIEGTLFGVASTSDSTVIDYAGTKDLSNKLADTEAASECLARKAFRFLTGTTYVERDLDTAHQENLTESQRSSYSCLASKMLQAFEDDQQSPRTMFIELATDSMLFLRR